METVLFRPSNEREKMKVIYGPGTLFPSDLRRIFRIFSYYTLIALATDTKLAQNRLYAYRVYCVRYNVSNPSL